MNGMSYLDFADKLRASQEFFERTLACMQEEDGTFQPQESAFSTIAQVAHAAQTVDWFMGGIEEGKTFNTDSEGLEKELVYTKTLQAAKAWFQRSMAMAILAAEEKPDSFWNSKLPEGPMFAGNPRSFALGGILDHNAHHRGALSVYARLCGHKPAMPYGEM
ncbi:MAG: putative damage-inducible protein DinB [Planctomycetota bacterium]|jgi:uncharacterized damage-inducible protein DinB